MVCARNVHVVYFVSSFPLLQAEITHLKYSQLFCLGINGIFLQMKYVLIGQNGLKNLLAYLHNEQQGRRKV